MYSRRQILRYSMIAGTGMLLPAGKAFANKPQRELGLEKYVDALPLPRTLKPAGKLNGATYYEVAMTEFQQKLHRDLPPTTVWGYDGSYPGPTIQVQRNEKLAVRWINDLPEKHLLPVDTNLYGASPDQPIVRTVVHVHGSRVRPESDGHPEGWITPGNNDLYFYTNNQQATSLWYHDHALGITRLNVYAGLAGFYLIRDSVEESLNLPRGPYEIPLVFQDRTFNAAGKLQYPAIWEPEFFGRVSVVNGKVWPYLDVEPRKYRFRMLNGANARFFNLKLFEYNEASGQIRSNSPGPAFHQIGTDGGLLPATALLNDPSNENSPRLLLSPAERADVIIDFSEYAGKTLILQNNAKTPFKGLDSTAPDDVPLHQVMIFRVKSGASADSSAIPTLPRRITRLDPRTAARKRNLTLEELLTPEETPIELLLNGLDYDDAGPRERPNLGDVEVWNLINLTADVHPIHLHLVQFQILSRQPFDTERYQRDKKLVYTGPSRPPDANEAGWKDTVRVNPAQVTRIIARFGPYPGVYMWHCHILEHEDNEMMRPYEVVG